MIGSGQGWGVINLAIDGLPLASKEFDKYNDMVTEYALQAPHYPTMGSTEVADAGTWGGWEGEGDRPAGWEDIDFTFQYGIDAMDAFVCQGGPGDLRSAQDPEAIGHGRLNVVRVGQSTAMPGERVTIRVVGGGFDESDVCMGGVSLFHEGELIVPYFHNQNPRVVEFDPANASRYRAFEVDIDLPEDAPLGVYDVEVMIGDIQVANYNPDSTVGSRWAGYHGCLTRGGPPRGKSVTEGGSALS